MAYFHLMRCVIDECNRCVRVLMFWVLLCGFWGITQEGSLAWPDPTRRKGLVQCLTWIVIMQSAHRLNYKYLPTAIVFDHSFHTSGVQGAKLFKAVPIMTTASYRTPIICSCEVLDTCKYMLGTGPCRSFLWVGSGHARLPGRGACLPLRYI